ncbi:hypothetical protein L596_005042 [Steinernema carpocapsae]|uniref:Translocon-associated protein subunit delta n=1 Tax=Steinernema carpocapsae TaxID=34508 RepID=A0A4U8UXU4_STECR|nr:hypothetical protein L596_005042 [Steinernema carpocapsae]
MAFKLIIFCALAAVAFGSVCENPKISAVSYSTSDHFFHFNSAFVVEFSLGCSNNARNTPLFAVIDNKIHPVVVSEETSKYQVSWMLPHSESYSRTFDVHIFDEKNMNAYKKAQRSGQDTFSVKPLYTHQHIHQGAGWKVPISTEAFSVIVACSVFAFVAHLKKKHYSF